MIDKSGIRNKMEERSWHKPALQLINYIKNKGDVLDLGCGLGEFSLKLKNLGWNVVCADGSNNYVRHAKKIGFKSYKIDFNHTLPFKDKQFDLVCCLEVIEHIEKAENLLNEINRILKRKNYLILSTPNFAFIGVRLRNLFGLPPPDEGYHFRFFTYKTLIQKLKNAGFELIKTNSISFIPTYKISKKKPEYVKINFFQNLLASKLIFLLKKI